MRIKELINRKITMTAIQRNFIIIIAMLSTLLLLNLWPRFLSDAMSFPLYGYIILIVVFSILLFRGKK